MDWWLLVSYVGVLAVGGYIGYTVNDWVMRKTFGEMMAEAGLTDGNLDQFINHWEPIMEPEQADDAPPSVEIKLELVDGNIFCWSKTTKEFLGQAKDRDDLIQVLAHRLGPVTLRVHPEDGAELLRDKTQ
jgi:hypothetical protein